MAGAVNMGVVALLGLILNVSCGNRDSTLSLLRCLVDVIESHRFAGAQSLVERVGDRRCQRGLTVVNVTNGANVNMGFGSFVFSFGHY